MPIYVDLDQTDCKKVYSVLHVLLQSHRESSHRCLKFGPPIPLKYLNKNIRWSIQRNLMNAGMAYSTQRGGILEVA